MMVDKVNPEEAFEQIVEKVVNTLLLEAVVEVAVMDIHMMAKIPTSTANSTEESLVGWDTGILHCRYSYLIPCSAPGLYKLLYIHA
jgi:hypothetical protein